MKLRKKFKKLKKIPLKNFLKNFLKKPKIKKFKLKKPQNQRGKKQPKTKNHHTIKQNKNHKTNSTKLSCTLKKEFYNHKNQMKKNKEKSLESLLS